MSNVGVALRNSSLLQPLQAWGSRGVSLVEYYVPIIFCTLRCALLFVKVSLKSSSKPETDHDSAKDTLEDRQHGQCRLCSEMVLEGAGFILDQSSPGFCLKGNNTQWMRNPVRLCGDWVIQAHVGEAGACSLLRRNNCLFFSQPTVPSGACLLSIAFTKTQCRPRSTQSICERPMAMVHTIRQCLPWMW